MNDTYQDLEGYNINMPEWFQENKKLTIAIDFDGTIVTHAYPKLGIDMGGLKVLHKIQERGHNIILFTMRSGNELKEAVEYLNQNGIKLFGINSNQTQGSWTNSPKVYANIYIDDAALGIPLLWDNTTQRPYVDWKEVQFLLEIQNVI